MAKYNHYAWEKNIVPLYIDKDEVVLSVVATEENGQKKAICMP